MKKTMRQLADELGVSKEKIRYQVSKLPADCSEKIGNIIFLNDKGISEIKKKIGVPQTVLDRFKKILTYVGCAMGGMAIITLPILGISGVLIFFLLYLVFLIPFIWVKLLYKEKLNLTPEDFNKEVQKEKERIQGVNELMEAIDCKQAAPWGVKYSTNSCPYCGHKKVRSATWDDKRISVAFWGAASDKIGKRYVCDHCKKMW